MITTGILSLIYYGVTMLIGLLPTYTGLSSNIQNSITWLANHVANLDCIIPVGTIVTIILLNMGLAGSLLLFRALGWVAKRPIN